MATAQPPTAEPANWSGGWNSEAGAYATGGLSILFLPPLLMTVFREKYPR